MPLQSDVGTELVTRSPGVPADALKSWYQQYTAQDGAHLKPENAVIRAVKSDVLDHKQIEAEVQQLIPETCVAGGFCTKCRHLLDNWPIPMFPDDKSCVVGRHFHTNELEAAARLGCRFCALLLSVLQYDHVLDAFQKIEARLRHVGDSGTASLSMIGLELSIAELGLSAAELEEVAPHKWQFLWFNFPGKAASHASQLSATTALFGSYVLPPSGEPEWSHPFHWPQLAC